MNRGKGKPLARKTHGTASNGGYPWRGFERPPDGCLFEQLIDLEPPMGIAYERSLWFEKSEHIHDRALVVLPRSGSSMRLRVAGIPKPIVVGSNQVAIVPARVPHDDHWVTEVYDTLALLPSDELLARVGGSFGASSLLTEVSVFVRSLWLDSLLEEYFAERVLHGRRESPRLAPLEDLVVMELYRLSSDAIADSVRRENDRPGPSSPLARALRYAEAHLFADIDLDTLCRAAAVSRSSLIRLFKSELETTPKAYILARRLDEAKRLLEGGRYDVGEVARLVGYDHAGAFSEAFTRRFGRAPSRALAR